MAGYPGDDQPVLPGLGRVTSGSGVQLRHLPGWMSAALVSPCRRLSAGIIPQRMHGRKAAVAVLCADSRLARHSGRTLRRASAGVFQRDRGAALISVGIENLAAPSTRRVQQRHASALSCTFDLQHPPAKSWDSGTVAPRTLASTHMPFAQQSRPLHLPLPSTVGLFASLSQAASACAASRRQEPVPSTAWGTAGSLPRVSRGVRVVRSPQDISHRHAYTVRIASHLPFIQKRATIGVPPRSRGESPPKKRTDAWWQ
jgi:hypothetical protein